MRKRTSLMSFVLSLGWLATSASADQTLLDNFDTPSKNQWAFFADTVMGGVSTGQLTFAKEDGIGYARLTGTVSTANRGGFIQFRTKLAKPPANDAKGVRLVTRGNDQPYFVHIRTRGTVLPWQYYQGRFDATQTWTEVRIPFSAFQASGQMVRSSLRPNSMTSIGIVAFGRDHQAEVDIKEIGFY